MDSPVNINIFKERQVLIAEIISEMVIITEVQDALDLMAECDYRGSRMIMLRKENITPDFFDLKTGIAGEILQKFSNYDVRLAIIGDFNEYKSKALRDFIYESNKAGRVCFVADKKEAIDMLAGRKG